MKIVRGYVRPHRLAQVTHALHRVDGLTGMSAAHGTGFGRGMGASDRHRAGGDLQLLAPHVAVEVLCRDELVDSVVTVIQQAAHTGLRGDGKVVVLPVERAVRIATGETGDEAL